MLQQPVPIPILITNLYAPIHHASASFSVLEFNVEYSHVAIWASPENNIYSHLAI
jgi:hypothetical protein